MFPLAQEADDDDLEITHFPSTLSRNIDDYDYDYDDDDDDDDDDNIYDYDDDDSISDVFILHPHGPFRLIWDILVIIILIYTCIEVPFCLAWNITLTLSMSLGIFALCIDCLLLIDVCLNFRTAYYDKYNPLQLIISPKEIGFAYLSSWFILDLFTSIPFEFLLSDNDNNTIYLIRLLRIFRLLRLFKLLRFFRMIKTFNNIIRGILTHSVIIILKLIRIISLMILTAHYIACIWWYFGDESLKYYDESWNDEYSEYGITKQYIKSFYFSVVTLFTTGYGDITPINTMEEIICSLIILLGTCFFAYFIGAISGLIIESDHIQYIQIQKIKQGQAFCVAKKLPSPLSIKVMTHLKYYCSTNYCFDENEVIQCLPPSLQRTIYKHCDKTYYIDQIPIFSDLNACIRGLIALKLKSISCGGDEYIFHQQQFGKNMYIQRNGISVIMNRFNNKCNICKKRTVFGYFSFIKEQRHSSLKTISYSEFYSLDYDDIRNILILKFPRKWHKFWLLITKQIQILYDKQQIYLQLDISSYIKPKSKIKQLFNQWFNINNNEDIRDEKVRKTTKKIKGDIDYEKEIISMRKQTKKRRESLNINIKKKNIQKNNYKKIITVKIEEQKQEKKEKKEKKEEKKEEQQEKYKKTEQKKIEKIEKKEKIVEETKHNESNKIDKTDKNEVELTKIKQETKKKKNKKKKKKK